MTTWTQFCPFLATYSPPYGKCKLSVDKNWHFLPPTHLFISTQSLNDPITEKRCKMLNRCFFYSRYQIFEFQVRLNLNNTELFELLKNLMIPHESKLVWIISIFIIIIHLTCVKKIGGVRIMRSQLQFVVTDSTCMLIGGLFHLSKILLWPTQNW